MTRSIEEVLNTVPDKSTVIGWGAMRLYPQTLRDMIRLSTKDYDGSLYAIAVNVEMANVMNSPDSIFEDDCYRPARQDGSLIGFFEGSDVHVLSVESDWNLAMLMCLDEEGNVVKTLVSEIVPNDPMTI